MLLLTQLILIYDAFFNKSVPSSLLKQGHPNGYRLVKKGNQYIN